MNILQESLYWLTSGLLVPCIVLLLFMLVQSLVAFGHFIASRRQQQLAINALTLWAQNTDLSANSLPKQVNALMSATAINQILASKDIALTRLLISHFESDSNSKLNRYSRLAKLGPIAGLVGTLIPMGPALQGLADGDIQQLAGQMQIAFTTTVIGLMIGAIGFSLYQAYKSATFKELTILDYLLEQQENNYGK